jgi:hypothetical protein
MSIEDVIERMRAFEAELRGCFDAPVKITIVVRNADLPNAGMVYTTESDLELAIAEMRLREANAEKKIIGGKPVDA